MRRQTSGKQHRPKLTEAHFEQQVRDFLEKVEGWRCFHFEQVWAEKRKRTFGEAGMPDLLCIRYAEQVKGPHHISIYAEVMWIEFKRPGGKVRANQKLWNIQERKRGALTVIAGADFAADFDSFCAWYRSAGLQRRT